MGGSFWRGFLTGSVLSVIVSTLVKNQRTEEGLEEENRLIDRVKGIIQRRKM